MTSESIETWAIIVSAGLTVPFLCYAVEIILIWFGAFKDSFSDDSVNSRAGGKLARGIFYSYVAAFLDSSYWLMTWVLYLFDSNLGFAMLALGSLANIFFRQIGGIMGATNHVKAADLRQGKAPHNYHKYYYMAGVAVSGSLAYFGV